MRSLGGSSDGGDVSVSLQDPERDGAKRDQVCVVGDEGQRCKLHTGTFGSTRTMILPVGTSQPWNGHGGPQVPSQEMADSPECRLL